MKELTDLELLTIKITLTQEKSRLYTLLTSAGLDLTPALEERIAEDITEIDSILKKIS